ncbi:MAG: ATP-dependent DNA helicase [Phycisphaerales bacterium]
MSVEQLTDAQRRAVESTSRAIIVLAGPGTGKTRVLVHRVAHLIKERKISPERVLACTFSVRAARELRERLAGNGEHAGLLTPDQARRVKAQTLHSFGAALVRRFADRLGLPARLVMIDPAQRRRMTKAIIAKHGLFAASAAEGADALAEQVEGAMDVMAERGVSPQKALDFAKKHADGEVFREDKDEPKEVLLLRAKEFADTATAYSHAKKEEWQRGWLSFADLILLPIMLLTKDQQAAALVRSEFSEVLVDEFQDNNTGQIELLRLVCGPSAGTTGSKGPAICVVGDDDQAIYGFRGADEQAFARFEKIWTKPEVIELVENYRSSAMVVGAANSIITRAASRFRAGKQIVAASGGKGVGQPRELEMVSLDREAVDGEVIAAMLQIEKARVGEAKFRWSECAVLVRTHTDAERVGAALSLEGIPWDRSKERTDFDEAGVEDCLAWAEWIFDPNATVHARRVLTRPPIGVDVVRAIEWEKKYRELVSKHGIDAERHASPGTYPAFLAAKVAESDQKSGDEGQRGSSDIAALQRALSLREKLVASCGTLPAGEAISTILQQVDIAHAELLSGLDRAKRVRALVTLLKLAKDKREFFDEPGDLGALLRYLKELRNADPKLESVQRGVSIETEDDSDEKESSGDGSNTAGRVQILTAHAAKGLEFDTVFVTRVNPPHGFPKSRADSDRWQPPRGLVEEVAAIDEQQAMMDEERRLFYVACTRAKRRLVLLARHSGKKSSSAMHFFDELVFDPPKPDVLSISRVKGADVLAQASKMGVVSSGASGGGEASVEDVSREFAHRQSVEEVVAAQQRSARLLAAGALERAGDLGKQPSKEEWQRVTRELIAAARRSAAISAAASGKDVPEWLLADQSNESEDESVRATCERIRKGVASAEVGSERGSLFKPVKPPLRLSYTSISDYLRCPRCWYAKHVFGMPSEDRREIVVGTAIHAALERFYNEWTRADSEGTFKPGMERLLSLGKECLLSHAGPATENLDEQLAQMRAQLNSYYEKMHDENVHVLEVEYGAKFTIPIGGSQHEMDVKIDRIDQMADGSFRVVDYKTGEAWKSHTEPKPDDLQLGIYAMAIAQMQGEEFAGLKHVAVSGSAEYWNLVDASKGVLRIPDIRMDKIVQQIEKAANGILTGRFEKGERCWELCSIL